MGGLLQGVNLFKSAGAAYLWAMENGSSALEQGIQQALLLWEQEAKALASNPLRAIFGDPFSGSRKAIEALEQQYPEAFGVAPTV
jgi:hypothetical protein